MTAQEQRLLTILAAYQDVPLGNGRVADAACLRRMEKRGWVGKDRRWYIRAAGEVVLQQAKQQVAVQP